LLDQKARARLSRPLTAVLRHVLNSISLTLSREDWASVSESVTSMGEVGSMCTRWARGPTSSPAPRDDKRLSSLRFLTKA